MPLAAVAVVAAAAAAVVAAAAGHSSNSTVCFCFPYDSVPPACSVTIDPLSVSLNPMRNDMVSWGRLLPPSPSIQPQPLQRTPACPAPPRPAPASSTVLVTFPNDVSTRCADCSDIPLLCLSTRHPILSRFCINIHISCVEHLMGLWRGIADSSLPFLCPRASC